MSSDTIYALSSAAGRAAVALVRVSGPQVLDILNQMAGGLPAARRASRRNIRRPGTDEVIDDGLDHGNVIVSQRIQAQLRS